MIKIVGVGAAEGYLTERAIKEIESAELVYGSKRAIEIAKKYIKGEAVIITKFNEETYRKIAEEGKRRKVVVLSTGDPMVSGLGKKIDGEVEPGISSVQLALARLKIDLTEVVVIDCHGKDRLDEVLKAFELGRHALILADSKFDIEKLRKFADVVVLENLGYENERICKNCEIKSNLVILFAKRR